MSRTLLIAAMLAVLIASSPAWSAVRPDSSAHHAQASTFRPAADEVSLDEAIRTVRDAYGEVTILKAETRGRNGRRVHRVKFLTDSGRVKTVEVDARTGDLR
ncbi:MAG: PepSY domain-containing protein [Gammaproteobacteria bacterium]|jgi:uncharacterized membrane protein YkoI|nr:MAG: PepSY domain-containing protein [Gammaproteobacteria bacterium]